MKQGLLFLGLTLSCCGGGLPSSDAGGFGGGSPNLHCVTRPEPMTLGGCLSTRPTCSVPSAFLLSRGVVDAGCSVQWRETLDVRVSMDAGCNQSGIQWAAGGGCDFVVDASYSYESLVGGQCFISAHTIRLTASALPDGGFSFVGSTGGYGEGGACFATFPLDGGS